MNVGIPSLFIFSHCSYYVLSSSVFLFPFDSFFLFLFVSSFFFPFCSFLVPALRRLDWRIKLVSGCVFSVAMASYKSEKALVACNLDREAYEQFKLRREKDRKELAK